MSKGRALKDKTDPNRNDNKIHPHVIAATRQPGFVATQPRRTWREISQPAVTPILIDNNGKLGRPKAR